MGIKKKTLHSTNVEIGKRLRFLRLNRNLKRYEVAKELNISDIVYNYIERGVRTADIYVILKACIFYNVDANYIFGYNSSINNDDKKKINYFLVEFAREVTAITNKKLEQLDECINKIEEKI